MFLNAGTHYSLGVKSCGSNRRKQKLFRAEVADALSVDGLIELVYELVNSSCMLVSTITMTSADQTA